VANKAAVSKADDKADCLALASGGRRLPPLLYARTPAKGFRRCLNALHNLEAEAIGVFAPGASHKPSTPIGLFMTGLSGAILG
jgi:hypothetical protein